MWYAHLFNLQLDGVWKRSKSSWVFWIEATWFTMNSSYRFLVDERGTMKSVTEYFKETYGYVIRHPFLPCLQVGNQQRPNYLPMEVCKIVEGQRYSKRLNEKQITTLLKVTCQRPYEREKDILQVLICSEVCMWLFLLIRS